jgi:hypothetical protein
MKGDNFPAIHRDVGFSGRESLEVGAPNMSI